MIVFLAEVTCQRCFTVVESTRSEIPRTREDYEREFRGTFYMKQVKVKGGRIWVCQNCRARKRACTSQ